MEGEALVSATRQKMQRLNEGRLIQKVRKERVVVGDDATVRLG